MYQIVGGGFAASPGDNCTVATSGGVLCSTNWIPSGSGDQLTCKLNANARNTIIAITAISCDGGTVLASGFSVQYAGNPTVTGIQRTVSGCPGCSCASSTGATNLTNCPVNGDTINVLTITGTNFAGSTSVTTVNGCNSPLIALTPTQITCQIASGVSTVAGSALRGGAGAHGIVVTTPYGMSVQNSSIWNITAVPSCGCRDGEDVQMAFNQNIT